ncbi:MAG: bifunctional nuclease family protein [Chlorobi bacterium]|nr:bifunctional nuclease family protein [Chlorobiota bacterium]
MNLIPLEIARLENSSTGTGAFLLHLKEKDTDNPRILPIVIGAFEAQAIIFGLEKNIKPPRPITHDLFYNVLRGLGYKLDKVIISKLHEGIFYSNIYLTGKDDNETYVFDSRTSDAVALAVRFNAPIYTYDTVMDEAGVEIKTRPVENINDLDEELQKALDELLPEENEELKQSIQEEIMGKFKALMQEIFGEEFELSMGSKEDLQKLLDKAIENEDYELAAKIRDLIKKREEEESRDDSDQPDQPDQDQ